MPNLENESKISVKKLTLSDIYARNESKYIARGILLDNVQEVLDMIAKHYTDQDDNENECKK